MFQADRLLTKRIPFTIGETNSDCNSEMQLYGRKNSNPVERQRDNGETLKIARWFLKKINHLEYLWSVLGLQKRAGLVFFLPASLNSNQNMLTEVRLLMSQQ